MKILGLIPARGGSKGLPGKNIKVLGGKPLIQYTLDSASQSSLLDNVIVSTDSEEIAQCVRGLGGNVPFLRPPELALDDTPTLQVVKHALQYSLDKGEKYEAVCLLQVTTPFRRPGFIDEAVKRFIESDADAIVSVLPVPHEYNPHWVFEVGQDGYLRIATGEEKIIPRRQALPPAYYRDGSIYITRSEVLLEGNSLLGDRLAYIVADPDWHVNIDTANDWRAAEALVQNYVQLCAQSPGK